MVRNLTYAYFLIASIILTCVEQSKATLYSQCASAVRGDNNAQTLPAALDARGVTVDSYSGLLKVLSEMGFKASLRSVDKNGLMVYRFERDGKYVTLYGPVRSSSAPEATQENMFFTAKDFKEILSDLADLPPGDYNYLRYKKLDFFLTDFVMPRGGEDLNDTIAMNDELGEFDFTLSREGRYEHSNEIWKTVKVYENRKTGQRITFMINAREEGKIRDENMSQLARDIYDAIKNRTNLNDELYERTRFHTAR